MRFLSGGAQVQQGAMCGTLFRAPRVLDCQSLPKEPADIEGRKRELTFTKCLPLRPPLVWVLQYQVTYSVTTPLPVGIIVPISQDKLAQTEDVIFLRAYCQKMAEQNFKPHLSGSKIHVISFLAHLKFPTPSSSHLHPCHQGSLKKYTRGGRALNKGNNFL